MHRLVQALFLLGPVKLAKGFAALAAIAALVETAVADTLAPGSSEGPSPRERQPYIAALPASTLLLLSRRSTPPLRWAERGRGEPPSIIFDDAQF